VSETGLSFVPRHVRVEIDHEPVVCGVNVAEHKGRGVKRQAQVERHHVGDARLAAFGLA
jgi:hypothetical protein